MNCMNWRYGLCIVFLVFCLLSVNTVSALKNPAAVYAEALGYEYLLVSEKDGGVHGVVVLPDGNQVSGWEFLMGKAGSEYSGCQKYGAKQVTVQDKDACSAIYSDTCTICELPNGTKIEVTELMGLDFSESKCGDGVCGMPENSKTCSKDCPEGGMDDYCDESPNDPDCIGEDKWVPPKDE